MINNRGTKFYIVGTKISTPGTTSLQTREEKRMEQIKSTHETKFIHLDKKFLH